jgi:hypothetical protein
LSRTPIAASSAGRFAKGQSGNPGGRPRAKPIAAPSAFDIIIDRTLTVARNGQVREITIDEALQQKTYQDAIGGSRLAQRAVMKMIARREKARAAKAPPAAGIIVKMESGDPGNANAALKLLGIAVDTVVTGAPRLKLETWAVQAALDRKRRSGFAKKDLEEARRNALAPDMIRWPRPASE